MQMRTRKPEAGNKFYITRSRGGYSLCIQGYPKDVNCDVLSNCVGYACGRFNEIIGSMKYPSLNCNAENFIERAISAGLSIANKPSLGGIMVWKNGTLSGNDGAGHVAIVERIDSENQIYTSESSYGSTAFWNQIRTNSNGRWGLSKNYTFRGCIINPAIGYKPFEPKPAPTPTVNTKYKVGDKVIIDGQLYGTADGNNPGQIVHNKVTTITRVATNHPYPYNTTGDLGWMSEASIKPYTESSQTQVPTPQPTTYNVGDEVIVNGVLTSDSYGGGAKTKSYNNQKAKIVIVKNDGRPRPYALNMNNNMNGVTGWGSKDQIRK